jgi:Flp pilus assembly protein TadG
MTGRRLRRLEAYARDRRGVTTVVFALCLTALLGFVALGVDLGHLYAARIRLQAATDADALAAAQVINQGTAGQALTVATTYGPGANQQNAGIYNATFVSGYPKLLCLTSTGVSCTGSDSANAIRISEQADIPTLFAGIFGISSWHLTTTATASAKGGSAAPLDVMIVLDATQSMNGPDTSCSLKNATRLDCALNGVRTLLASMPPCSPTFTSCSGTAPLVQVGLMVFPGVTSTTEAKKDYDCSTSQPATAAYNAAMPPATYEILPLSSDYRASASAALNTSSNIVIASRGGASGCQQGITAVGGVGTYFADAVTAAQAALLSEGRANTQKVIVFLGDGDAKADKGAIAQTKLNNECAQAVTAAKAATAAGTKVYTIAYGASTVAGGSNGSCTTDSPAISACTTLQTMASDSSKFFSDTTGGTSTCTSAANSITDLSKIFSAIVVDVTGVRLVADNAT